MSRLPQDSEVKDDILEAQGIALGCKVYSQADRVAFGFGEGKLAVILPLPCDGELRLEKLYEKAKGIAGKR